MVKIRRVPREQMRQNHAEVEEAPVAIPTTVAANLDTLLDMGDTTYVMFRGMPYGVPPVGWPLGLELMSLRQSAAAAAVNGQLTRETTGTYRTVLARMATLLWGHMAPVAPSRTGTWFLRWRKRWRLMRNPMQGATELDLVVLCDFCLRRRMISNIGVHPTPRPGT